jgi:hypothetical protein
MFRTVMPACSCAIAPKVRLRRSLDFFLKMSGLLNYTAAACCDVTIGGLALSASTWKPATRL